MTQREHADTRHREHKGKRKKQRKAVDGTGDRGERNTERFACGHRGRVRRGRPSTDKRAPAAPSLHSLRRGMIPWLSGILAIDGRPRYRSVSWSPGRTTGDRLGDAIPRAYRDEWCDLCPSSSRGRGGARRAERDFCARHQDTISTCVCVYGVLKKKKSPSLSLSINWINRHDDAILGLLRRGAGCGRDGRRRRGRTMLLRECVRGTMHRGGLACNCIVSRVARGIGCAAVWMCTRIRSAGKRDLWKFLSAPCRPDGLETS